MSILEMQRLSQVSSINVPQSQFDPLGTEEAKIVTNRFKQFASPFYKLAEQEGYNIHNGLLDLSSSEKCEGYARRLQNYMPYALNMYAGNAEQSSEMILTCMEIWVEMDKSAVELYPLLCEYETPFPSGMLDVLVLPERRSMERLQAVEVYLHKRSHNAIVRQTIFSDPCPSCFGVRFVDQNPKIYEDLRNEIEFRDSIERQSKEIELQRLNKQYDEITDKMNTFMCPYVSHDRKECKRCYQGRVRNRLAKEGIRVFEHFLPSDSSDMRAVLFELAIPPAFSKYRDGTWSLLASLCYTEKSMKDVRAQSFSPLSEYGPLCTFFRKSRRRIGLSSTKKSYISAHFGKQRIPALSDNVILPHRMEYSYFDSGAEIFLCNQRATPSIQHHCQLRLPDSSPYATILASPTFGINIKSSYATISSQTHCSQDLNIHEYLAFHSLFFGKRSRWLNMLIELGSSTLNFSSEAIMLTCLHLAWETGPADEKSSFRVSHNIFKDENFCRRMLEQISDRVSGLAENHRESFNMNLLLSLLLRLWTLSCEEHLKQNIEEVVVRIRFITRDWAKSLRCKIHSEDDDNIANHMSEYALWAALICRKTFVVNEYDGGQILQEEELTCFLEASIIMNENIRNPSQQPPALKNSVIQTLELNSGMKEKVHRSVASNIHAVARVVNQFWPDDPSSPRTYATYSLLKNESLYWLKLNVAGNATSPHTVALHLLEGFLLVDGQMLGKLPPQIQENGYVKRLFPKRNLLTYPSSMKGMSHLLTTKEQGHQVHFGFQHGKLIIRAIFKGKILQFVEPEIFGQDDLPKPCVQNCYHWLVVHDGAMNGQSNGDLLMR